MREQGRRQDFFQEGALFGARGAQLEPRGQVIVFYNKITDISAFFGSRAGQNLPPLDSQGGGIYSK